MKKLLIVGSTGYLGLHLVEEGKRRGYWVRALARNPGKLDRVKDAIDEIFVGEITTPDTLKGVCDGIDVVISALGVGSSRTNEKISMEEVDYGGNKNVLDLAVKASVKKFIFVSFIDTPGFRHLEITRIKRMFERDLQNSGLEYAIIRPTAFFADMKEFFKLAKKGTVYLMGHGNYRVNAIHGADLAKFCVDAIESGETDLPVGGPVECTYQEAAELAFKIIGTEPKIKKIPGWPFTILVWLMRPFLSKRRYTSLQFLLSAMQNDALAPPYGTHTLEDFFRGLEEHEGGKT
jgi:uncharacterized protein YbjT (DUF2867 family)